MAKEKRQLKLSKKHVTKLQNEIDQLTRDIEELQSENFVTFQEEKIEKETRFV